MEKIMSKTANASKVAALEDHRPLADSELDAVSGASLIATVLKDLHDMRSAIINNLKG
jgi:hypothetical protein